jgi:hypothetical protein
MAKKEKVKVDLITKEEYETLNIILNKIRVQLNSSISIRDTLEGLIIIQTYNDSGIIRSEVKTKSIKTGVNFLCNKIY